MGSPPHVRFAAPSPEVFKGFRQDLLQTPPKLSPQRCKSQKQKKRSTRIPDFAQLVFRIKIHPTNSLDDPPIHTKRIMLLVEIKRAVLNCDVWYFDSVLDQTDRQACRAFASCPEVNTLGLIVALGDCWTYREYSRENMRSSPSPSEKADPTFCESPFESLSPSMACDDVNKFFGDNGFARLQETPSDHALKAIHHRLKTLFSDMF
jgi:hypothetical protein